MGCFTDLFGGWTLTQCVCVVVWAADPHLVCLDEYPIHTVTGLVKQWLRELPDPLLTFIHYNDFLRAIGKEREGDANDARVQEGQRRSKIKCIKSPLSC